jgi:hypothetical protein
MQIQRKSEAVGDKKKLTGAGKGIIIGAGVLAVAIIIIIIVVVSNASSNREAAQVVDNAISHAVLVAKGAVSGNDAASREVQRFESEINGERRVDRRVALTQDMLNYVLGQIPETATSNRDELSSARNRVANALRDYNAR